MIQLKRDDSVYEVFIPLESHSDSEGVMPQCRGKKRLTHSDLSWSFHLSHSLALLAPCGEFHDHMVSHALNLYCSSLRQMYHSVSRLVETRQ